jgi:hypothetical protein
MEGLRKQLLEALWDEHFADDQISGVTKAECLLLTERVLEKLQRAGILRNVL